MKSMLLVRFVLGVGFLAVCGPALAHHGSAAYSEKLVELKQATVTKFLWASPHCLINFDAKNDKGNVEHWVIETGPATNIGLIGWTKTTLAPGDVVTVYVYPAKTGNSVGRLNKIVLPDGTELHDTQLGGDAGKNRYNVPGQGPTSVPNTDSNSNKNAK
jgi:Family of unknown function (DUF6152)